MIKKIGNYEIIGEIGKGAMGVVYKARDLTIDRIVALKTIRLPDASTANERELIARLKQEAQAAGRLSHPNIVVIYEYGEENGIAFISMGFVEGRELKSYMDSGEKFSLETICNIMSQTLDALAFSHKNNIIHRDIKPSNIMLMANGHVMMTDFGIARLESSELTQAGVTMGTPNFMSPEQCMGQRVDGRSDLFSAGVVLYQLLTGEKPFDGPSIASILQKIITVEPLPPSQLNMMIPIEFDAVISKALAKRPAERFPSVIGFAAAIKAASEGRAFEAEGKKVENPDSTATLSQVEDLEAPAVLSTATGVNSDATVATSVSEIMIDDATVISSASETTDDATVMFSAMDENVISQQETPAIEIPVPPAVPPKIERGNQEKTPSPMLKKLLLGLPILVVLVASPFFYNYFTAQSPEDGGDTSVERDTPVTEREIALNQPVPEKILPVNVKEPPIVTKMQADTGDETADIPTVTNSQVTEDLKLETKLSIVTTSLAIHSTPENVQVEIVGHNRSWVTPFVFEGGHGILQLYFSKTGYQDLSVVVELKEGENLPVHVKMFSL